MHRAVPVVLCVFFAACGSAPARVSSRAPNVLLITIDTLRADRVGRGLTPNLDALAARATRFTRARTTVPLTLPSHAAILSGTLPPENGVRQNGDVLAVRPTLARAFRNAGYRTGAFVGAYVLDRRFGLSGGFDVYDDRVPRAADGEARFDAERRGDLVADAALTWLKQTATAPFFAWVHLYDPHAPYDPPQEYLDKANGNAYDGEVAFADAQVGRLLDWLRTSGLETSTVVAIAGDHGEGLGDHGEQTHGMLAYDSTLRVPLVVADGKAPAVDDANVSLADLAAALLHAAGVPVPDGMRSAPLGGGAAYSETVYPRVAGWHPLSALAFEHWKFVRSSEAELYDVAVDPGEMHNLAGEKLATVDAARRRLAEFTTAASAAAADDGAPNPVRGIAAWNAFERLASSPAGGEAPGALRELTRLARLYPDGPAFQAAYARALKDTGRPAQAVDLYRRLVTRWPRDAAMYHDLAGAAQAAGMTAEAVRAEQASLALQPANAAASNGLGLLLVQQGAQDEAVHAFERATEDDPSNAVFWANLGQARRAAGDLTRAEQAYAHALDLDPRAAAAANGMGLLLVERHRPADAIRWFERALAGSPRFLEARLNLAAAYLESGSRDNAIDAYRRVLADAPPGSREYQTAAQQLAQLGRQ